MTAVIVLCRHGNTFEKGQPAFMVGRKHDLPLTREGLAQATLVGEAIQRAGLKISRTLCGPLLRTRDYAAEILRIADPEGVPEVDERLCELDYGSWNGLTTEEIKSQFGSAEIDSWNELGEWPSNVTFEPSYDDVRRETADILDGLKRLGGVSILVTSNGRVREFGNQCRAPDQLRDFKMKTGGVSILKYTPDGWRILAWNVGPLEAITADLPR